MTELLNQNLVGQDLSGVVDDQFFQLVFAFTGILSFIIINVILGTIAIGFLLNANRIPKAYSKAFIFAVATLIPIIALEVIRCFIEFVIINASGEQTVYLITNQDKLSEYLGLIYNSNYSYNAGLRIILLSIRMGWTAILVNKMFMATGIMKQKSITYAVLFTILAGGGFDLLNQLLFLYVGS